MDSASNKSAGKNPPANEPTAYSVWGTLAGAIVGLIIGLATNHWLAWSLMVGTVGLTIGALIDRSRR
jgi:hypothetical protein